MKFETDDTDEAGWYIKGLSVGVSFGAGFALTIVLYAVEDAVAMSFLGVMLIVAGLWKRFLMKTVYILEMRRKCRDQDE